MFLYITFLIINIVQLCRYAKFPSSLPENIRKLNKIGVVSTALQYIFKCNFYVITQQYIDCFSVVFLDR